MTRDDVLRLAREAGFRSAVMLDRLGTEAALCDFEVEELARLERFAALVAAAVLARMPPPPIVVDVSSIDPGVLADIKREAKNENLLDAWRAYCASCNENAQSPFDSFSAGFAAAIRARGAA